jgi:hypothetical protein
MQTLASFAAETGGISDVISAHRQLTKVELDSARTSDERIKVLTAALERAQELESDVKLRFEAGTVSQLSVLQAQQYRMEVEAELAKLQPASNK